jgi:hypothetical protein
VKFPGEAILILLEKEYLLESLSFNFIHLDTINTKMISYKLTKDVKYFPQPLNVSYLNNKDTSYLNNINGYVQFSFNLKYKVNNITQKFNFNKF